MKKSHNPNTLVVITGPTAVGKTETSLIIAEQLNAEIISADARQFYKELTIGTAAPTPSERQRIKHHFAGHLSVFDYYNASQFEQEALARIEQLFHHSPYVVVSGGSGLYIDALCNGIDDLPDIDPEIRADTQRYFKMHGLEGLRQQLKSMDPDYYDEVDKTNPNRMMRGIEVFMATGQKFSHLRKRQEVQRPFQMKKVILNRPRHELFERINQRTDRMVKEGLVEEALRFFKYRHLNALNTVGYKELFAWLENRMDLQQALEKIRTNTRRYAKRQITWFKRYKDAQWFLPSEVNNILRYIKNQ